MEAPGWRTDRRPTSRPIGWLRILTRRCSTISTQLAAASTVRETGAALQGQRHSPIAGLSADSNAFAAALAAEASRRAIASRCVLPNCPQFFIAEFGAWKAGAIVVPAQSDLQRARAGAGARRRRARRRRHADAVLPAHQGRCRRAPRVDVSSPPRSRNTCRRCCACCSPSSRKRRKGIGSRSRQGDHVASGPASPASRRGAAGA